MIPEVAILHWRHVAPWPQDVLVEQDLILSRALVELFQREELAGAFALRGGTALHKLYFSPSPRYSEDIDLVQSKPGPIGPILDAARACLDPFLGEPRREHNPGNITLRYRMASEIPPVIPMRLKIEINTREHFSVFGRIVRPFAVSSPWFKGKADVATFSLEELLATKLRALYQRRKGRDLFDLHLGLGEKGVDPRRIVEAFRKYLEAEGNRITRKQFEKNLHEKMLLRAFHEDLRPLLATVAGYDAEEAARRVTQELLALL